MAFKISSQNKLVVHFLFTSGCDMNNKWKSVAPSNKVLIKCSLHSILLILVIICFQAHLAVKCQPDVLLQHSGTSSINMNQHY